MTLAESMARHPVGRALRSEVEDFEATLERWSQNNELDAWAFLTNGGVEVQDAGSGRVLATIPVEAWEDFARNVDHGAISFPNAA